jgi:hypothetical protein
MKKEQESQTLQPNYKPGTLKVDSRGKRKKTIKWEESDSGVIEEQINIPESIPDEEI